MVKRLKKTVKTYVYPDTFYQTKESREDKNDIFKGTFKISKM